MEMQKIHESIKEKYAYNKWFGESRRNLQEQHCELSTKMQHKNSETMKERKKNVVF